MAAIKEVADRVDGKAVAPLSHEVEASGDMAEILKIIDGSTRGLPSDRLKPQ